MEAFLVLQKEGKNKNDFQQNFHNIGRRHNRQHLVVTTIANFLSSLQGAEHFFFLSLPVVVVPTLCAVLIASILSVRPDLAVRIATFITPTNLLLHSPLHKTVFDGVPRIA